jgi:phosphoglycolate phosphatase-like HAD superfamily hydrolase
LNYDSVIWDFDGVLADSQAATWQAASDILSLLGTKAEIRSQEIFRRYFKKSDAQADWETLALRDMLRLVMKDRAHLLRIFPCIELVPHLRVPSRIISSGLAVVAQTALGRHGTLFADIRGREHGTKDQLLRSVSDRGIFISDTVGDISRSHEQSRTVIAVGWGYDSIAALKKANPTFLAESSTQLEALLRNAGLIKAAASF